MEHYDTVLRRRSAFRDQAGRNLAMALAVPDVLDKVTAQLAESPSWKACSIFTYYKTPESYPSFLEMHRRLAGADTIPAATSAQFAGALSAAGQFDEALEVAALTTQQPLQTQHVPCGNRICTRTAISRRLDHAESSSAFSNRSMAVVRFCACPVAQLEC